MTDGQKYGVTAAIALVIAGILLDLNIYATALAVGLVGCCFGAVAMESR